MRKLARKSSLNLFFVVCYLLDERARGGNTLQYRYDCGEREMKRGEGGEEVIVCTAEPGFFLLLSLFFSHTCTLTVSSKDFSSIDSSVVKREK